MKTGSDLTELQAFRNHTAHKQLCLLGRRKDVDGSVTNSVQYLGLPGRVHWHCQSVQTGQDSVVMEWLRRQPCARDGSCVEDVHSASHCLVGWAFFKYFKYKFRVGGGFKVLSYIFSDVVSFPRFIVNCLYF